MIRDALRALLGFVSAPALPLTRTEPPKGSCVECGAPGAHAAHLVPRVAGGTRTFPLCEACHGKSHGLDFHDHGGLTRAGMRRAAELDGKHIGRCPFGFRRGPDGRLEEDPTEQFLLGKIITLRSAGLSWSQVANQMNSSRATRRPDGRPWHYKTIQTMFSAPRIAIRERYAAKARP